MASAGFAERLAAIKASLVDQGDRVVNLVERAFECYFVADASVARQVIDADEPIDDADLEIERLSLELLADASRESNNLPVDQLRHLLVIVKANNELERIADAGVMVAEGVFGRGEEELPAAFRVVTNSVIGIVRDAVGALDRDDAALAKVVLQSEDCVREFKTTILKDAEHQVGAGTMSVHEAFNLHEATHQAELMADHATNIAEQVIYATTGAVVRHQDGKWVEVDEQRPS